MRACAHARPSAAVAHQRCPLHPHGTRPWAESPTRLRCARTSIIRFTACIRRRAPRGVRELCQRVSPLAAWRIALVQPSDRGRAARYAASRPRPSSARSCTSPSPFRGRRRGGAASIGHSLRTRSGRGGRTDCRSARPRHVWCQLVRRCSRRRISWRPATICSGRDAEAALASLSTSSPTACQRTPARTKGAASRARGRSRASASVPTRRPESLLRLALARSTDSERFDVNEPVAVSLTAA